MSRKKFETRDPESRSSRSARKSAPSLLDELFVARVDDEVGDDGVIGGAEDPIYEDTYELELDEQEEEALGIESRPTRRRDLEEDYFEEVDLELRHDAFEELPDLDLTVAIESPLENLRPVERHSHKPKPPWSRAVVNAWILAMLIPLAVGSVFYVRASASPDIWLARAEIQYRGTAWTETQDVAIQSRSLVAPVAERFDIPIGTFEKNLDAGLVTGTQVVRVDYRSSDPEEAKAVVRAVALNYIAKTAELTPQGVFTTLEAQRDEIERSLRRTKIDQSEIPPGNTAKRNAERAAIAAEIDALEQRLTVVESKILEIALADLDLNANRVPVLLTEPFVFSSPVAPKPLIWAGAGLVSSLLVCASVMGLVVFFLAKRDRNWLGAPK